MAKGGGLHIDRWSSGLVTNRAATSTPIHYSEGHAVQSTDALIDGSNVEISPANTLARRPGFPKYCSSSFGVETPKGFTSAILAQNLYKVFDTGASVYQFDTTTLTSIFTKATTAQTHYQQVGNLLYFSDGTDSKKWDGGAVSNAGIATPPNAPTIPNLNFLDEAGGVQTVHAWVPNAVYSNTTGSAINFFLLAPTGEIQWSVVPAGTTLSSQSSAPNWSAGFGTLGAVTNDGTMTWTNSGPIKVWKASTLFTNALYTTNQQMGSVNSTISLTTAGSTTINWQIGTKRAGFTNSGGFTGNTNTLKATGLGMSVPTGATIDGIAVTVLRASSRHAAVQDVTVKLLKAGTPTGNNKNTPANWAWTTGENSSMIPNTNGKKYTYGSNTDLWGAAWVPADIASSTFGVEFVANVSDTKISTASLVFPITITVYYHIDAADISGTLYADIIKDSNGNLQRVTVAGTSGSGEPTWSTTIGGTVTDGGVTWECLGTANQLPCLFNRTYAFGFHSGTHVSTLSPTLVVQAPIIGNNVNVHSVGSDDTQVDSCDLYRTPDGGSVLLFDTSTPNVNASTAWDIQDIALDSDLNFELIGPVAHANDPPPVGMTLLKYHMGRMWGVVDNLLYFSAGPDCINGDGNQAWPLANVFTFTGPVYGIAPTSQGLVVFTSVDMSVVLGGPQLQTFWVQPLLRNLGILSPNCITQDGDDIVIYTAQRQMVAVSPNGKNEMGFDVAPTLALNFDPSTAYIAIHRAGQDQGLFISDGSTKIQRFNINAESWDPIGTPVGGIGPIGSIDTAIGTHTLVSTAGGFIVARDTATFADSGSAYAAYATIGSLVLSEPGEPIVKPGTLVVTSAAVGTALTVQVLPNEISGSFTTIPSNAADPFQLPASSTISMKRYSWLGVQTPLPALVKHMQIKITMPTEAFKNEIFTLGIV